MTKTLKDAIKLVRMRDEQLTRQRKTTRPPFFSRAVRNPTTINRSPTTSSIKRLPWEEMQHRRALGLCFNCNERFTAGHKCQGPQLLLLEVGAANNENANNE